MRQILSFFATLFSVIVMYKILHLSDCDDIIIALVSTIVVLIIAVGGDIYCHVNKLLISKYDVAADLLGIGVAFVVLLIYEL